MVKQSCMSKDWSLSVVQCQNRSKSKSNKLCCSFGVSGCMRVCLFNPCPAKDFLLLIAMDQFRKLAALAKRWQVGYRDLISPSKRMCGGMVYGLRVLLHKRVLRTG